MGQLTVLGTIQQVAGELGLPIPASALSATDNITTQMLALATRAGQDLFGLGEWSQLQTELLIPIPQPISATVQFTLNSTTATVTSAGFTGVSEGIFAVTSQYVSKTCRVAAVSGNTVTLTEPAIATALDTGAYFAQDSFAVPTDFAALIPRTYWDRGRLWELQGPLTPQEDQWIRSGIVAQGPRRKFRKVGRDSYQIVIRPTPTTSDLYPTDLVFEYISAYWINDASGNPKAVFTLDTDTTIYEDLVFTAGLKWRYLQAKGFEYQDYQSEWAMLAKNSLARANPGRTLNLTSNGWTRLLGASNVPDGNFPGAAAP